MSSNDFINLSSLLKQSSIDDHEQILKEAEDALRQLPTNISAQHVRVIALLKLDRYEAAVQALEAGGDALQKEAMLAWVYALYKAGRLTEAQQIVTTLFDPVRSFLHVEAQIAYRSESFWRAAEIYEKLVVSSPPAGGEFHDLRINRAATDVQALWAAQSNPTRTMKATNADFEQFETAFNAACGYIAQGNLKQAEYLLHRAYDLCVRADDLSDHEKTAELLPIRVQQLYVLSQLGRSEEAKRLCADINVLSINDLPTRLIAQVNILSTSSDCQNQYLCDRLIQAYGDLPSIDTAFRFQASALSQNRQALDLLMGKTSSVIKSTLAILSETRNDAVDPEMTTAGLLNAAAHSCNRSGRVALKQILPLHEKRPDDVGLLLTIVQLYVIDSDVSTATSILESFFARLELRAEQDDLDVRYAPGLVAILVALYNKANRSTHSRLELAKSAVYWRRRTENNQIYGSLFKEVATALVANPSPDELQLAHDLFQMIEKFDQSHATFAGLCASADLSLIKDRSLRQRLPAEKEVLANINVAELERAGIPRPLVVTSTLPSQKRTGSEKLSKTKVLKKPRHSRISKSYDPSVQPDPERWLPLRDRSYWKPKGKKKGRAAGAMATQGGIASEDSRPATPTSSQVVQQSKPKKKKGKGGK